MLGHFELEKPGMLSKQQEGGDFSCHDDGVCGVAVPPGMRREGDAHVRSGGSVLMDLFMEMD